MRLTRITLAIIALVIAAGFNLLVRKQIADVEPQLFQATEEAMVDAANILAAFAESELEGGNFVGNQFSAAMKNAHGRKLDAVIYNHRKTMVGMDFYVTDSQGIVLHDSAHPERVGEDFSRKRDVHLTLQRKYGARSSRKVEGDDASSIMYVAALIGEPQQPLGVLTVYKAQSDVYPIIRRRISEIWWGTGLIGGGILFCVIVIFIWQYLPISRLTEYTRKIERGERAALPYLGLGKEVNTLAHALESMREALEGRRFAERYIQTVTHEMKSPLAAIRGAAELLEEDFDSMPEMDKRHFLENIRAETLRADRLLTRLLELSALEGKTRLENTETLDLRETVRSAVSYAEAMASLAKVKLSMNEKKEPMEVRGDPFILRAAVTNLLENAVDFSAQGGEVMIGLETSGGFHRVTVSDRGCGIPDYARERVFERFFSLRHLSAGRKGTGLGLTLVKEAAELHLGSVSLDARKGGGTKAALAIPAK